VAFVVVALRLWFWCGSGSGVVVVLYLSLSYSDLAKSLALGHCPCVGCGPSPVLYCTCTLYFLGGLKDKKQHQTTIALHSKASDSLFLASISVGCFLHPQVIHAVLLKSQFSGCIFRLHRPSVFSALKISPASPKTTTSHHVVTSKTTIST
jgi:hypothetical protein